MACIWSNDEYKYVVNPNLSKGGLECVCDDFSGRLVPSDSPMGLRTRITRLLPKPKTEPCDSSKKQPIEPATAKVPPPKASAIAPTHLGTYPLDMKLKMHMKVGAPCKQLAQQKLRREGWDKESATKLFSYCCDEATRENRGHAKKGCGDDLGDVGNASKIAPSKKKSSRSKPAPSKAQGASFAEQARRRIEQRGDIDIDALVKANKEKQQQTTWEHPVLKQLKSMADGS